MTRVLNDNDTRDQMMLDEELPVLTKLLCGAVSGATAQSSKFVY